MTAPTFPEQLAALRRTLHRAVTKRLAQVTERPFQHLLALRVVKRGEIQTQAALAERLLIDPPAASRLVDKLVKDGLMARREGHDRRCVRLEVTARAESEVAKIDEALRWLDREMRRHASPAEIDAALVVLGRVRSGFIAHEADDPDHH